MVLKFEKMVSKKTSEFIVEQVFESFERGTLKPGDKLPTEEEIAEQIGVSRPSVREAFGALRLVGVIERKGGSGTYVRANGVTSARLVSTLLAASSNPFEVFEARKVLEPAIAKIALHSLNPKKLLKVESTLEIMQEAASSRDYMRYHISNSQFHKSIIAATENSILCEVCNHLIGLFHTTELGVRLTAEYLNNAAYIEKSLDSHRRIYAALCADNSNELDKAYSDHFEIVEMQLEAEIKS